MNTKRPIFRPSSVHAPFLSRFTDARADRLSDTRALYQRVQDTYAASPWSQPNALDDFATSLAHAVSEHAAQPISPAVIATLAQSLRAVLALESAIFADPANDRAIATLSLKEQVQLRRLLRSREYFVANTDRIGEQLATTLIDLFAGIITELPPTAAPTSRFTVPLISLVLDPYQLVDHIVGTVTSPHHADLGLFDTLRQSCTTNLCAASNITVEQAIESPHRLIHPINAAALTPDQLVHAYLQHTPFAGFLLTPIPFSIPRQARFEHVHILAGTGHGKTQLLQTLMLDDFDAADRPAVVAIDSQGDMLKTLSRLARFDPAHDDRLVILDPADTEWPLKLNMFDVNRARIDKLPLGAREQLLAGIIELYEYIFGSLLGAELTQKQSVVFRYIARLMIDIPDASIQTLRQLMEDATPFTPYIARLTGTTRAFFDNEFNDRSFIGTKQQIRRRLYGVLSNPTFERIFSHPKNAFDMKSALDAGKVVLINTAKDVLKAEASAIFGRYMIALNMQAALERASTPETQRRPAFVSIDESADYFDQSIDTLLLQARKYKVGLTLAHQFLDQLTPALRASVMTNPAIRFAGGISQKDAHALDADMRTTTDFLMRMHKRRDNTDFACYVRNVTPSALKLTLPLGAAEREPTMSDDAYARLLVRVRSAIAAPFADVQAHIDASAHVASTPESDDFADRY